VDTVLGLSLTSSSIGWVLLDGPGADANTLDHDVFDVSGGVASDGDISAHLAGVRGVQSIAATSGYKVKSIGVTWTEDADAKATLLMRSLPEFGFDRIDAVKLPDAIRTWARSFKPALGFEKCAVCIVESAAVTALSFGYDSVRSFSSQMRESADGIGRWLTGLFTNNGLEPETVFLVGSRGDLELISDTLEQTLSIPVDASADAQLAPALGAALALSFAGAATEPKRSESENRQPRWRRPRPSVPVTPTTDALETWTEVLKKPPAKTTAAAARRRPTEKAPSAKTGVAVEPQAVSAVHPVEDKKRVEDKNTNPSESSAPRRKPAWAREPKADNETEFIGPRPAPGVAESSPRRPAWQRETPVAAAPGADQKTAALKVVPDSEPTTVKTTSAQTKTEAIELPVRDEPTEARKQPIWYGPHARAAAAVIVGLVAVFALGPLLFGQKENKTTEERPVSGSSSTSASVEVVPSQVGPPAAIQQAAAEPVPAPPPPAVLPPPEDTAPEAEPAVDEAETMVTPEVAEPMVAPQAPAVEPQPVVAPQPVADAAVPVAASPAPEAAPPAPDAALAPPPPPPGEPAPEPPPQDPVMVLLDPLFGALP
jgi:hypothetical protein